MANDIIGFPFDSQVTYDELGNPTYDRAVSSKPLKTLISKLFTTGVMPNPSNNLLVSAGTDGMTTIVEEGFCIIEGGLKLITEPQTMIHQASDTNYDRIDTVVMRWDNNDDVRHCGLFVLAGTPATEPVRPTLTRDSSVYEIGLADVLIKANSTVISANRVTDTRYDSERCGVITSISEYDTTYIYQQVQADLAEFKADEQAEFVAWFETIRGILDEDVAGHLQNEIDELAGNFAPVELTNTATVATSEGGYVVVNGLLYKATSDIAVGDTYVVGTNITATTVGTELSEVNSRLSDACNVRYNEETDYVQIKYNDVWTNWQKAYLQSLVFFNSTIGYNSDDFGTLSASNNTYARNTLTIDSTNILIKSQCNGTSPASSSYSSFYTDFTTSNYIDITNYDKIVFSSAEEFLATATNYPCYMTFYLVDESGNSSSLYTYTTTSEARVVAYHAHTDKEISLANYSGNYKLKIRLGGTQYYSETIYYFQAKISELYFT